LKKRKARSPAVWGSVRPEECLRGRGEFSGRTGQHKNISMHRQNKRKGALKKGRGAVHPKEKKKEANPGTTCERPDAGGRTGGGKESKGPKKKRIVRGQGMGEKANRGTGCKEEGSQGQERRGERIAMSDTLPSGVHEKKGNGGTYWEKHEIRREEEENSRTMVKKMCALWERGGFFQEEEGVGKKCARGGVITIGKRGLRGAPGGKHARPKGDSFTAAKKKSIDLQRH